MPKSIRVIRKYVRKRRPPERGTLIGVRLQRDDLALLDQWIADSTPKGAPARTRPQAVRYLMEEGMSKWRVKKKHGSKDWLRDIDDDIEDLE